MLHGKLCWTIQGTLATKNKNIHAHMKYKSRQNRGEYLPYHLDLQFWCYARLCNIKFLSSEALHLIPTKTPTLNHHIYTKLLPAPQVLEFLRTLPYYLLLPSSTCSSLAWNCIYKDFTYQMHEAHLTLNQNLPKMGNVLLHETCWCITLTCQQYKKNTTMPTIPASYLSQTCYAS